SIRPALSRPRPRLRRALLVTGARKSRRTTPCWTLHESDGPGYPVACPATTRWWPVTKVTFASFVVALPADRGRSCKAAGDMTNRDGGPSGSHELRASGGVVHGERRR